MSDRTFEEAPGVPLVVGLGASAGGLRALEAFFHHMPPDSGCCFIVVQHLSPDFRSLMDDLLARQTTMRIRRAEENLPLERDTIYLIPPKKLMTVAARRLHLTDRPPDRPGDLPIDIFLESLAADARERAVAVILSGTGSDGTEGARAVHAAGGWVIVQDPSTAEFDGMPSSAVASGVADHVLAPEAMPQVVTAYARDPAARLAQPAIAPAAGDIEQEGASPEFAAIFAQLRRSFGIDFSHYKLATVERRINRRLKLSGRASAQEYSRWLHDHPAELDALYRDLLIGVTQFFRDPAAFAALRDLVYEPLLRGRENQEIRVWIAACATGEEAYTHAILLDELAVQTAYTGRISIFATDVHRTSLERASAGVYTADELAKLSPERLARYFRPEKDGTYRIIPELRQRVVFAPHNVLSDPPFTKIDVVGCRNLLIYLQPAAQERVIGLLHYALRRRGVMMLGLSEGLGRLGGDFEVVDAKQKLFRKHQESRLPPALRPPGRGFGRTTTQPLPRLASGVLPPLPKELVQAYDHLLAVHLPPGFIVNGEGDILHFIGNSSRYLLPETGRAHDNLLARSEGELRLAVSTLLPKVVRDREPARARGLVVAAAAGVGESVDLEIVPLPADRYGQVLFHLSLRPAPPAVTPGVPEPPPENFAPAEARDRRIAELESELATTKENLQATVEELQTSNEELQAANEEMLAANEELQSTNEELHSVNEELYTVNAEFERKNLELNQTVADLDNLFEATDSGTLFLDRELRIRRFNSGIREIFKLLPQDLGRPIEDIAYHLADQHRLIEDTRAVLLSGRPIEGEVRTREGSWLLKRILPLLGTHRSIDGVVLTFTRIDFIKSMQAKLDLAMASSRLVWWEWDIPTDRLTTHAAGWCILGYELGALEPTSATWFSLTHPDDVAHVRTSLDACLDGRSGDWECEHRLKERGGGWRWVLNKGRVTERDESGRPIRMLGTTQDIHLLHTAERRVVVLTRAFDQTGDSIIVTNAEGLIEYVNPAFTRTTGYAAEEVLGQNPRLLKSGKHPPEFYLQMWSTLLQGRTWRGELINRRKDGSLFWQRAAISPVTDGNGRITNFVAVKEDITAAKAERERRERLERQLEQSQKMETLGTLAGGIAHDFNNLLTSILGFTRLALESVPEGHGARDALGHVESAGRRAAELVRRILAFSRHHAPVHHSVVLGRALAGLMTMLRSSLPTTIELGLHDGSEGVAILGDEAQLEQAVVNLCTNAAHAIGNRPGVVHLDLGVVDVADPRPLEVGELRPGRYVRLMVADTGAGMDPAIAARIFEPFFTTKAPGEGTGLGLTIVHNTVLAHGGAIGLQTAKGKGTTFTLFFPAAETGSDDTRPREVAAAEQVPTSPPEKLRIAIVDDEEDIATLCTRALARAGYEPVVFPSPEACLAALRAEPHSVALVITDQTMPGMTGIELARALRQAGNRVPVLLCSGFTRLVDAATIDELAPSAFIAKPFMMDTFFNHIRALLNSAQPQGDAQSRPEGATSIAP